MKMRPKFDAMASTDKYKDGDGNEKTRYVKVGTIFEREDGSMCMKMEALPVSKEWNGWLNFYESKRFGNGSNAPAAKPAPAAKAEPPVGDSEDLPF